MNAIETTRLTKRYGQRSAVVAPTNGDGHVLGAPVNRREAYLGRVGALIKGPAFHPRPPGESNRRQVAEVLARVELSRRAGERFGT
jgi:ABC-2 type transport system ATP-binding protein